MKIAELRHMDGVKGKIELSDTELLLQHLKSVIHSNVKRLVEQQQSIFRKDRSY